MSLAIQVNNSLRVLKRAQAYFAPTTDGRSFADAILPPIFLTSDPPCRSRLESHGSQQTLRWYAGSVRGTAMSGAISTTSTPSVPSTRSNAMTTAPPLRT